jgi:hypothetical protein
VPAAAVIPAPLVYIKVVAVKKLVVGFLVFVAWPGGLCVSVCAGELFFVQGRVFSCLMGFLVRHSGLRCWFVWAARAVLRRDVGPLWPSFSHLVT